MSEQSFASGSRASVPLIPSPSQSSRINLVTYRQSTIKALIDPTLPVQDVIRQLCANAHLGVQEPPALFALRDDSDEELIDDSNMSRKIETGANFKLCSSPTMEAVEMVDKLSSSDERVLKMATYTLQRFIREKPFTQEFIARKGLAELLAIISSHGVGNTLAYALASCQNLMEYFDEGWDTIDGSFIAKVVHLLVSQERINVCRPATAILKKLVVSGPQDAPKTGRMLTETDGTSSMLTYKYGFEVVHTEIRREKLFLQTLVSRLGSADTTLKLYSLSLLNSLMRNVSDGLFESFTGDLEALGAHEAVTKLMDSSHEDELSSSLVEYQSNVLRAAHRRMRTVVTPTDKRHVQALSYIWRQAKVPTENPGGLDAQSASGRFKWRHLGFASESTSKEFGRVGWLGLQCLESFVRSDIDFYSSTILEHSQRPEDRRCPLGRASIEVTEILADYYHVESGYTTSTSLLPFLLSFDKVHHLALRFWLRMWNESGAATSDFSRVAALVRSQVTEALRNQHEKTYADLEQAFLHSEYRTVRDRQMKELEVDEDYNSKASIRNLRSRIYRESHEFVRQQRIQCLLEGAWFRHNSSQTRSEAPRRGSVSTIGATPPAKTSVAAAHSWRFYRLSPNQRHLHFCHVNERVPIRAGLDDLPDRIDLSQVTDISQPSSATPKSAAQTNGNTPPNNSPKELIIRLLSAPDESLADLRALNASQYSEWTDGLNMLRGEGGVVSTRETADYVQILTEIGVKVKLLDLTGEQVDVPVSIFAPPLPTTTDFFFAEL